MCKWIKVFLLLTLFIVSSAPLHQIAAQTDCPDAPPPRLGLGTQARVIVTGEGLAGLLRVRDNAGVAGGVLVDMKNGDAFSVIDGPTCLDNYLWWQIVTTGGITGWVAEGSLENYFVEPLAESNPNPLPIAPNRLVTRLGNGSANSVAWSPDGQIIAVAGSRGVWLYTSQLAQMGFIEGPALAEVAWSPDGTRLVGAAIDGTLPIWDMTTQQIVMTIPAHPNPVRRVSWSADGRFIASVSTEPMVRIWDAITGRSLQTLDLPGEAQFVRWNPVHNQLAASYATTDEGEYMEFAVKIWEGDSFSPIGQMDFLSYPHIQWSADGSQIAGLALMDVMILTVSDGTQTRFMTDLNVGGSSELGDFVWTPEGDFLWGASYVSAEAWSNGITRGVYTDGGYEFPRYEMPYELTIRAMALRPGNSQLAVVDAAFVSLLNADTLQLVKKVEDFGYPHFIWNEAGQPRWSEAGQPILTEPVSAGQRFEVTADSEQWTLQIQDTTNNQPPVIINDDCFANTDFDYEVSPDNSRIAVSCPYSATIDIWDTTTGAQVAMLIHPELSCAPENGSRNCWIGWSSTGRYIHLKGYDFDHQLQLYIWDPQTAQMILTQAFRGKGPLWSPDDRYFASGGSLQMTIWDTTTWQTQELSLPFEPPPYEWNIAWSPDSIHLASTILMDQRAVIWDATGVHPPFELLGHTSRVSALSWSPDGLWLATGDYEGTVRIWDVSNGQLLLTLPGHQGQIWIFYWKPDGSQLAVLSEDRTVRVWHVR
ncbi:MAG: hypothetical protein K8L91_11960 [Anaerolineae bacterium]|nr:hypothetical protein [Anaerolineae bacterium]